MFNPPQDRSLFLNSVTTAVERPLAADTGPQVQAFVGTIYWTVRSHTGSGGGGSYGSLYPLPAADTGGPQQQVHAGGGGRPQRPMTGLLGSMTEDEIQHALAYDGPQDFGNDMYDFDR